MSYYLTKIAVTTALVVLISEISKRSTLVGAVLASIPLVSVLAMIWLYSETRDVAQIAMLSRSIFWLVLPSLVLFVLLPMMLQRGYGFATSLTVAAAATVAAYYGTVLILRHFGIRL